MVIGSGTMAKAFTELADDDNFLVFASGVANSKEVLPQAFEREHNLLIENISKYQHSHFIYFGTCSIYDLDEKNSTYVLHKLAMEEIIKVNCPNYTIFRVSNVAGFTTNTTTILSYLVNNIKNNIAFKLWAKAYRNILAIDDIAKVVMYLIKNKKYSNRVINVANPQNYAVGYLVNEIELFFQIAANYETVDKGSLLEIDTTIVENIFPELGIHFTNQYISQILHKYYR